MSHVKTESFKGYYKGSKYFERAIYLTDGTRIFCRSHERPELSKLMKRGYQIDDLIKENEVIVDLKYQLKQQSEIKYISSFLAILFLSLGGATSHHVYASNQKFKKRK